MPHLLLGILIMLAGAVVMAGGLYVRQLGVASPAGRTVAHLAGSAVLLLIGLAIVVAGIVVSFETNSTAPR